MEVNTIKTVAVFAVIFGCFAVLYPKIFHPMIMQIFGHPEAKSESDFSQHMPPHLRKPGMQGTSRPTPGAGVDSMHHMKHAGPHPGMRAAAEMQKQAGGMAGRGGGMMGVVLPMYAIGIIIYLVYTLSKVFSGKKKKDEDDVYVKRRLNSAMSNVRYDGERRKFMYGERDSDGEDDEEYKFRQNKRKQKDLERLLFKADKDQISELEMRELKNRLLETETQMSRILQAMETVSQQTEPLQDDDYDDNQQQNDDASDMYQQYGDEGAQEDSRGYTRHYDNSGADIRHRPGPREQQSGQSVNCEVAQSIADEMNEAAQVYDDKSDEDSDENVQDYDDDDFENSSSEIEENIEIEDDENEYPGQSREQGDGEECAQYEGEYQESESESGKFDEELTGSESGQNESETGEELIDDQQQYLEEHVESELRKRTLKGDPRSNED